MSYRNGKDAKLEYEIKATNLLDTESQSQSNTYNSKFYKIFYTAQFRNVSNDLFIMNSPN